LGAGAAESASLGSGTAQTAPQVQIVEYYHSGLDHYFVTADPDEMAALDTGRLTGWTRTGYQFTGFARSPLDISKSTVCRFYGLPQAGLNSHFYSGSQAECAAVMTQFASSWMLESSDVFQIVMPDVVSGACPASMVPVYRLFNNRADANHRYVTDASVRDSMLAKGYISEGYGPDSVTFCAVAPQASTPTAQKVSVNMLINPIASDIFSFGSTVITAAAAVLSYAWNFGDDTFSSDATTSHQYATSGTFPVSLTVTDSSGAVGTDAKTIIVAAATPSTVTTPPGSTTPPPLPPGTTPAGDFAARSNAPGVVRVFDFDTVAQLGGNSSANFGTFSNSGTSSNLPVIDTTVSASGAGSLRFDINSQSFPDAQWFANFSPDLSTRFGENSKFYVQWRQRFSQAMIDTIFKDATDGSDQQGIKQFIVGPGDTATKKWGSCESIHIVNQTYWQHRMVIGYNSCTGSGTHPPYSGFYTTDADMKYQNGTPPYCLRSNLLATATSNGTPAGCVGWYPNEWMTFQIEVTTGPRNNSTNDFSNSTYKLWIARENQPSVLVIDWNPGTPGYFPLAAGVQSDDQQFGKVWLLPYMTNVDPTQVHPLAQTWYDELIISRQPINDPGVGIPPPGVSGSSTTTSTPTAIATPPTAGSPPPVITPSAPGSYPAWRQGRFVNQFFAIPNTANMGGTTSERGTIDFWNGLGAGPTSLWSLAAGGDGGPLNAVISIDLAADAPKWFLNHAPSSPAAYSLMSPYYLDGTPVARHTYFSTQYITSAHDRAGVDRVMLFSDFAPYGVFKTGQFGGGPQVDGFRVMAAQWDPAGTWQSTPIYDSSPMTFAKDPVTENVYMGGGYQFAKWTASTGQWTSFTPVGTTKLLAWDDLPSIFDAKRGRFVVIHDGRPYYNVGVVRLQAINVAANTYVDIPVTGAVTALSGTGGAMVHDTDNDRYLLFWKHSDGSTDVFAINPDTAASSLIANVPQVSPNTMYGRAAYMPVLGGVAYLPSFASNVMFMPTR
jgi:PKD repeat protein